MYALTGKKNMKKKLSFQTDEKPGLWKILRNHPTKLNFKYIVIKKFQYSHNV